MSVDVLPAPSSAGIDATLSQPALSTLPLPLARSTQSRPPLIRKGTSYLSNASNGSIQSCQGCRLLWRGKIMTEQRIPLHGVAIIAHLFSVPSNPSPQTQTSFSPFDDPFSSSSKASSSGADMCLGLEMLRGKDLNVVGEDRPFNVSVQAANNSSDSPEVETRKGKGKEKGKGNEVVEEVRVETPTDVRVYIDQRCIETVEWFQDRFCREGGQSSGLRLDAGGEQVIVFASIPDQSSNLASSTTPTNSPSTSTSAATATESLPPLTLLLGRPIKPVARRPRPDDPLPRESLFTAKLRKTASLPASAFSKTSLSLESTSSTTTAVTKKKRLTSKDKAIASLMGKNDGDRVVGRPSSNPPPPNIAFPLPLPVPAPSKRSLSRSVSTSSASNSSSRLFSNNSSRQSSLPPTSTSNARPFKRSKSSIITNSSQFLIASPPPLLSNDLASLDPNPSRRNGLGLPPPPSRSRSVSRGPSPTPSIASTSFHGIKEEEESEEFFAEESDRLAELRDVGIRKQRVVNGLSVGIGGMKRSTSLPSGTKGFLSLPTKGEGEKEVGGVEVRNKNTIKKLSMIRMAAVGVGRDHDEFKEIFSMVTRGVGFALRGTFKKSVLSISERDLAESLIEQHLRLYLPPNHFVNPLPMSMASTKPTLDQYGGALKSSIEKEEDGKISLQDQLGSRGNRERSSDTIVGDGEGDGDVESVREEEAGKSIELLSMDRVKEVAKDENDDDDAMMLEDTQVVETQMQ